MTGADHMESLGNAIGTWPGWSLQWAQDSAGAAELSLRQQHCCEPWVSWDQSPLPAAQQALLRSGVGGKRPLWLVEHLKEQPVSPRMDSLADRDTCGVGKAKREQRESPWIQVQPPLP